MNKKEYLNQHTFAIMILTRSWKKNTSNNQPKKISKKKYVNSPLKTEIIDQSKISLNDYLKMKRKYHLIA